jgi:hypothetical protein
VHGVTVRMAALVAPVDVAEIVTAVEDATF